MGKVIKVDDDFYAKLRRIAEERGISLGEAAKLAGQEIPPPSDCEVAQFQKEVEARGLPPQDPAWIFGFCDSLSAETLRTLPMLSAYAEAIAKARGICPVAREVEQQLQAVKAAVEQQASQLEPEEPMVSEVAPAPEV